MSEPRGEGAGLPEPNSSRRRPLSDSPDAEADRADAAAAASPKASESQSDDPQRSSAAGTVAAGIFTSRILGFVRERTVAHFFGVGAHADVFQMAFKGPNLLQNLLGEGTISAAFIPIYSRMIEAGRAEEAGRFAGAIFGLLLAVASVVSLIGIVFAEPIVAIFTPGFLDDASKVAAGELSIDRYALAVQAVRIIFPMTGILVLAAWCLGVLNSHRKFFLPYFAPVVWNIAIISGLFVGALLVFDSMADVLILDEISTSAQTRLLFAGFYGALVGGLLQFVIQLPLVIRMLKGFRISFSTRVKGVREAIDAFGPVVAGRGVYQLSSYLDLVLASLLAAGAVASLRYAQMLYLLPVSLFGLSVAASELPELSRFSEERIAPFVGRLNRSMKQMLFMTVPTLIGYLIFGFLIVGAIFRTGSFNLNDSWLVYMVLGGYSLGLLATTMSRLLQNAFYALNDTKTPAKIAVVRVLVSAVLAVPLMFLLDRYSVSAVVGFDAADDPLFLGAVGLSLGTSVGAWIELWRLTHSLRARISESALPWRSVLRMGGTALMAAVPSVIIWAIMPPWHVALMAVVVVAVYASIYLGASYIQGAPEMHAWMGRFRKGT